MAVRLIEVTSVKNILCGGREEGVCLGNPPGREVSLLVGGRGAGALRRCSRSKPTHWEGSRALLAGGFAARASRSKPTLWEGLGSLPVGGFAAGVYCTEYS